jgi:hypothetical protein
LSKIARHAIQTCIRFLFKKCPMQQIITIAKMTKGAIGGHVAK